MLGAAMVAAAVVLGGGLGEATAVATSASSGSITVEVTVSAPPTEGPLIAHFLLPAGAGPRLALDPGPDRAWTGSVEVRRADWRVVFEDVSTGALSQAVSLTELGVAPEALVPEGLVIPPAGEGPSPLWLVVAAASSAAAAVLLAGSRGVNPRHLRRRPRRRRSATN